MKRSSFPLAALALFALISLACSPSESTGGGGKVADTTREHAKAFFEVYAQRSDFETFLDFYAEDAVVEDIVNGDLIEGRPAIRAFFDWNNPQVTHPRRPTLVVSSLVVEGRHALARGHFTEFLYGGQPLGPWRFVITLEFDADGKIQRQEDFINYPDSLLDPERKSSNERI